MAPFRRLTVWKKAHELVLRVYQATADHSRWQHPGLAAQLRTSAAAVAAKIVEGSARDSPAEFIELLDVALRLARELDYHLLLATDLGALGRSDYARLNARIDQVCRMLLALKKTVQQRARAPSVPSHGRRRSPAGAPAPARSA
ncbi:MAG TPA: four helix bundle protein [Gemmatimonadaceae bacterium]|nr:four helix bundle protein [Gemmatimonadaceae bacterium]